MKAIINGKIILKDQIIHNSALLFTDVITGIVPEDNLPTNVEIIDATLNAECLNASARLYPVSGS